MSIYPSLEDMKVDHVMKAQEAFVQQQTTAAPPTSYPTLTQDTAPAGQQQHSRSGSYPGLAEYMGMEFSEDVLAANMPEYLPASQTAVVSANGGNLAALGSLSSSGSCGSLIAPLSGSSPGLYRAQVSHGVRQVVLCKDRDGKVGMRVKAVNKGIFVCLVAKESPAAIGGMRFGDQILQINGENVAGYSSDKVHGLIKKAAENNIVLAVRDRPFERTLTLHKDSTGHIGFQFKEGKITSITVGSSAARNGLLIDHNLLEVNGQNVVGVKDKETGKIIDEGGDIITITIIPTFIYSHIMKNMSTSLVKKMMDHSIPEC